MNDNFTFTWQTGNPQPIAKKVRDYYGVYQKESLQELLDMQCSMLSTRAGVYLKSLLELEASALREPLDNDTLEFLKELTLYRNIAVYNIINRAKKIIRENEFGKLFPGIFHSYNWDSFSVDNNGKNILNFIYRDNGEKDSSNDIKIGTIKLYRHLIMSEEKRKEITESEKIKINDRNIHNLMISDRTIKDIERYYDEEKRLNKIAEEKSRQEALQASQLKPELDALMEYYNLLLQEYGLTDQDFGPDELGVFYPSGLTLKKNGFEIKRETKLY